jgi:hypothetical protein
MYDAANAPIDLCTIWPTDQSTYVRYGQVTSRAMWQPPYGQGAAGDSAGVSLAHISIDLVGRCTLTVSKHVLKARMVSAISA